MQFSLDNCDSSINLAASFEIQAMYNGDLAVKRRDLTDDL